MPIFFFTGIEGSTRLWESHTAEMGAVLARHDALLQELAVLEMEVVRCALP